MDMPQDKTLLAAADLGALFDALRRDGYRILGPTLRDHAIVHDEIDAPSDLPRGWTDSQEAGRYRLKRRADEALFGYAVGPRSWKRFLHPPKLILWNAKREGDAITVSAPPETAAPSAFIGVRACELAAIAIQDKVFLQGPYVDPHYRARRERTFIVAVNCSVAAATCFCVSMNTGPKARTGFDIALTEIIDADGHRFLAEAGSAAGRAVLDGLAARAAEDAEVAAADAITANTAASMGRQMPAGEVRDLLMRNLEHPRWADIGERCLSCANCTMVCPTCFCTTVEDTSDLTGEETARGRRWDSCFTADFSYIHGGPVRPSPRARYRQWLTHKLSTWHDQFGTSGCVGCGRCITWCPAAIDITEEVRAIADSEPRQAEG